MQPQTCPTGLLAYYVPAVCIHLAVYSDISSQSKDTTIAHGLATVAAFMSTGVLLYMPCRPPRLDTAGISPVGHIPNNTLRSPEDDLQMYQFLTVSWMKPLINLGNKGRLNPEHVWLLAFQFQHRRLHEAFRLLRGSVIRRLLTANAIDFIIIGSLSLGEVVFGTHCIIHAVNRANQPRFRHAHLTQPVAPIHGTWCIEEGSHDLRWTLFGLPYGRRASGSVIDMVQSTLL